MSVSGIPRTSSLMVSMEGTANGSLDRWLRFAGRVRGGILRARGHTLIELIVTLAILSVWMLISAVSLGAGLDWVGNRSSAQVWQAAAASGQLASLWSHEDVSIRGREDRIRLSSDLRAIAEEAELESQSAPVPNISRWQDEDGVRVSFGAPFASPDGAGSLWFPDEGSGFRVVIRAESGVTRREIR